MMRDLSGNSGREAHRRLTRAAAAAIVTPAKQARGEAHVR